MFFRKWRGGMTETEIKSNIGTEITRSGPKDANAHWTGQVKIIGKG